MSVFRCKMCGGTIEFEEGATVGVCDSCGTKQTLPRLDSDRKANLYDRANHFRRNNDFDKAMSIYEQILNEDNTDSEAYWSLVLCRYGIEYVEDPSSHMRIPTVNRTQYTSILADEDYKAALRYADGYQRSIYEEEARAIDDIQKGILEISTKEAPFDVFISFKETDANGRRTPDAVLANDLYHQLTQEGFKVFYAPITLEDKLGTAYEPYIFAALNSAKVMVVLGTKPENFNAVWVKNEWSRYLALIKNGARKTLIPAYKDMDPYDLPEEFSHLMAQDMSKLGFMQDLIRGIRKIVNADTPKTTVKETVVVNAGNANTAPLLKRAFMFLEDGNWSEADGYCERVLDQDPENAKAYLGKLMAEKKARRQEDLKDSAQPFDTSNNYQKVIRFADPQLAKDLKEYIDYINTRNELARKKSIYAQADESAKNAKRAKDWNSAAELFQSISGFEDANQRAEECRIKAEELKLQGEPEQEKGKKLKKTLIIATSLAIFALIAIIVVTKVVIPNNRYNRAVALMEAGNYKEAISVFEAMDGYKDSEDQIKACQTAIKDEAYSDAVALMEAGQYEEAITAFEALAGYQDSTSMITECNYQIAVKLIDNGNIVDGYKAISALNGYKDSNERANEINDEYRLFTAKTGDYVFFGNYEQDNNNSNGKEDIEWLVLDKQDGKLLLISKYALDRHIYNSNNSDISWENSELRKWLNEEFLNSAFSSDEKGMIAITKVMAEKIPGYDFDPGNDTEDKVFLLNLTEIEKYLPSDESRECTFTKYAAAQDPYCLEWWLRAPGYYGEWGANILAAAGTSYVFSPADCKYSNGYSIPAVRPAIWIEVGSYEDEENTINGTEEAKDEENLKEQTIIFGSYEQDNNTSNGKEDIEWLVLDKQDGKVLLISKYALDCQKYITSSLKVTWETCTLRQWLNGEFMNNAFSSDEQSLIEKTTVTADKNPNYSTDPGNATNDKVFLLSIKEVEKYFNSDSARQCQGTAYCFAQGAYKNSKGNCWWWLRSPGYNSTYAACVNLGGSIYDFGSYVDCVDVAVRPAMWIDLSKTD